MDLTSYEIEQTRFATADDGADGYDRAQVDRFRSEVARAMAALERELDTTGSDLEGIVRLESRRTELEAAVAKLDAKVGELRMTLEVEQAEAEEVAREEARRITAAALEDATTTEADVDKALAQVHDEGAHILEVALAEAAVTLERAEEQGHQIGERAIEDLRLVGRRLAQLRTALSDIEGRLRAATGLFSDEIATVRDLIDLETRHLEELEGFDVTSPSVPPALESRPVVAEATSYKARSYSFSQPSTVIDLTDDREGPEAVRAAVDESAESEEAAGEELPPPPPDRDDAKPGFYQRRLAGLRERIERENE